MYLLADVFSRVKVAFLRKLKTVVVLNSRLSRLSLLLMYSLGYLHSYNILSFKYLKIHLKYFLARSVIRSLSVCSRPGFRSYMNFKSLRILSSKNRTLSIGFLVFSTSKGLKLDTECSMMHIGGEILFFVS